MYSMWASLAKNLCEKSVYGIRKSPQPHQRFRFGEFICFSFWLWFTIVFRPTIYIVFHGRSVEHTAVILRGKQRERHPTVKLLEIRWNSNFRKRFNPFGRCCWFFFILSKLHWWFDQKWDIDWKGAKTRWKSHEWNNPMELCGMNAFWIIRIRNEKQKKSKA